MTDYEHPHLKDVSIEQIFKALGDPIRLAAVVELMASEGEMACGTFTHNVTKPTFSHHLQILREAGITMTRMEGTKKFVSIRAKELNKQFPGLLDLILKSK